VEQSAAAVVATRVTGGACVRATAGVIVGRVTAGVMRAGDGDTVATYGVAGSVFDAACACAVCGRWSRAYLRHLHLVGEPGAARLLTIHNLAWTFALVARLREAVAAGTLARVRAELAATWA